MDIDFLALSVLELESWVYREKVVRKGIVVRVLLEDRRRVRG